MGYNHLEGVHDNLGIVHEGDGQVYPLLTTQCRAAAIEGIVFYTYIEVDIGILKVEQ